MQMKDFTIVISIGTISLLAAVIALME